MLDEEKSVPISHISRFTSLGLQSIFIEPFMNYSRNHSIYTFYVIALVL